MPTLGAGTFVPNGQFSIPRAYLRGIWLSFNTGAVVTWVGNVVDFADSPIPAVTGRITFRSNFWDWSSNRYTLDHVVIESFYRLVPSPTENPLPFALTWYYDTDLSTYLVYNPFSIVGTGAYKHDMPARPSGFWYVPPWG